MAKPIEATPVLRGKDLVNFAQSLAKTESQASVEKRASARSLLKRVTKQLMMYRGTGVYEEMAERSRLVRYSADYPIKQFDCGVKDYNDFLVHDAKIYEEIGISSVHLLIHAETQDVLGYVALLTDSFFLDKSEKEKEGLTIPFSSVPALKIGKLAVSKDHKGYPWGSFLLELCLGYAEEIRELGISCRFLTVDADTELNPETPQFYVRNGFEFNEHRMYRGRSAVSMRYDLF